MIPGREKRIAREPWSLAVPLTRGAGTSVISLVWRSRTATVLAIVSARRHLFGPERLAHAVSGRPPRGIPLGFSPVRTLRHTAVMRRIDGMDRRLGFSRCRERLVVHEVRLLLVVGLHLGGDDAAHRDPIVLERRPGRGQSVTHLRARLAGVCDSLSQTSGVCLRGVRVSCIPHRVKIPYETSVPLVVLTADCVDILLCQCAAKIRLQKHAPLRFREVMGAEYFLHLRQHAALHDR